MGDGIERIIGQLEEFKTRTLDDLTEIKRDVKALQRFKWQIMGGAGAVSILVTALIQILLQ